MRVGGPGGDSDTLMAARPQPNDDWGSVGKRRKAQEKSTSVVVVVCDDNDVDVRYRKLSTGSSD